MPALDETRTHLLSATQKASHRASSAWSGFANFALQDNVLEVAVGLMYVNRKPSSPQRRPSSKASVSILIINPQQTPKNPLPSLYTLIKIM